MKRRWLRTILFSAAAATSAAGFFFWQMRTEAHRLDLNIALSHAVHHGDVRLINRLIEEGADPNVPDDYVPPKETVVDRMKRILLGRPAPRLGRGNRPLMVAAAYGDLELVRTLLACGADAKATTYGMNALLFASGNQSWQFSQSTSGGPLLPTAASVREIYRALLDAGADPNAQVDDEGYTPYRSSIHFKDDEIDCMFLQHGAKWNIKDLYDQTALVEAVYSDRRELVKSMLADGADPNENNSRHGESVLELAAARNKVEVARILLDAGAKVNYRGGRRFDCALMEAIGRHGSPEMVKLLLDRGADPRATNNAGQTVMDIARERGDQKIIKMLEAAVKNSLPRRANDQARP